MEDALKNMGDDAIGIITVFHYDANHDSALNKTFVATPDPKAVIAVGDHELVIARVRAAVPGAGDPLVQHGETLR